jgi:hypothetical protein
MPTRGGRVSRRRKEPFERARLTKERRGERGISRSADEETLFFTNLKGRSRK